MTCMFYRDGDHDWVLVPPAFAPDPALVPDMVHGKLLWACPCGEFRWTRYADWAETNTPETGPEPPAKPAKALAAVEALEL